MKRLNSALGCRYHFNAEIRLLFPYIEKSSECYKSPDVCFIITSERNLQIQ